MKFADIARAQAQLHQRVLRKEAGVVGSVVGGALKLPFRAAGAVAKGVGRVAAAPVKAGARSTMKQNGKLLGGLMVGGAALGTVGAASHAVGKSKEYNRGFDPRMQNVQMQRTR
jgi:hypothetical protein